MYWDAESERRDRDTDRQHEFNVMWSCVKYLLLNGANKGRSIWNLKRDTATIYCALALWNRKDPASIRWCVTFPCGGGTKKKAVEGLKCDILLILCHSHTYISACSSWLPAYWHTGLDSCLPAVKQSLCGPAGALCRETMTWRQKLGSRMFLMFMPRTRWILNRSHWAGWQGEVLEMKHHDRIHQSIADGLRGFLRPSFPLICLTMAITRSY